MATEKEADRTETSDNTGAEAPTSRNEIRMARKRPRKVEPGAQRPIGDPESQTAALSGATQWHIPRDVKQRFVQVGKIYYFRDGTKAFEDHGRRLTTPSENTEVIASLVTIAQRRGWERVIVSGSERFRQETWRQASKLGLSVRGYSPTDVEKARLAQDMASTRATPTAAPEGPARPAESKPEKPLETDLGAHRPAISQRAVAPEATDTLQGKLLEASEARFRHDPKGSASYFVRLATASGERIVWGRDLERALSASHSQPKMGDEVVLRRDGREAVSVRIKDERPDGTTVEREEVKFRTRWSIETRSEERRVGKEC